MWRHLISSRIEHMLIHIHFFYIDTTTLRLFSRKTRWRGEKVKYDRQMGLKKSDVSNKVSCHHKSQKTSAN